MVDDDQVFRGRDYANSDWRIVGGDDGRAADVVAGGIDKNAEGAEAGADFGAAVYVVFADAAGEDEHIESAELGHITADPFGDGPGEFVDGQASLGVAGFDCFAQVAHIVG